MSDGGGYDARLTRAEAVAGPLILERSRSEERRFTAALEEIIGTMGTALVEKLNADDWEGSPGAYRLREEVRFRAATAALVGTNIEISVSPLAAQFTLSQQVAISADDFGDLRRPLVMPQEVAEVYLSDPRAINAAECTECRYKLPVRCGWTDRDGKQRDSERPAGPCNLCGLHMLHHCEPRCGGSLYFSECPLCGGFVGASAWRSAQRRKRNGGMDRLQHGGDGGRLALPPSPSAGVADGD